MADNKIINMFVDADEYRKECCSTVIEQDMCEQCPLNYAGKCVWFASIGEHSLTDKDYKEWLEYVDCIEVMGADYIASDSYRRKDDEDTF